MLEALIALAILAVTLLGLLYIHMRTLANTESALRRSQALHLIDDLAERIRANPRGADELASYCAGWGEASATQEDCETQACNPAQLARWDLGRWKANVARALPAGDAIVFRPVELAAGTAPRALSVLVGWRARSGDNFEISVPGAACPDGRVCQFGHVQP